MFIWKYPLGYAHLSSGEMYAGQESVHLDPRRDAAVTAREHAGTGTEIEVAAGARAGISWNRVRRRAGIVPTGQQLEGVRQWLSTVKFRN